MKKRPIFVVAALCFLAISSLAGAEGLFYVTGKIGTTSTDADIDESLELILDGDDEGASYGLGLRLGDHITFELAYHDFGSASGLFSSGCSACDDLIRPFIGDTTAVSLTALPHLPVSNNFFAYGKLGIVSWETGLSDIAPGLEDVLDDYSDEDLTYGIGVRYLLPGPLGVFAEFERFADSFETVSMGATLGF